MEDHFEDFVKYYERLGDKRESWIKKRIVREHSIARKFTLGEKPTHNKVCCCKLEQKQSKEKINWLVVQQKWLEEELNIHGEKHKIGQPKKVWEICGTQLGSYSYFMYLNPYYELAFEGVAREVGMDLGGDMISRSSLPSLERLSPSGKHKKNKERPSGDDLHPNVDNLSPPIPPVEEEAGPVDMSYLESQPVLVTPEHSEKIMFTPGPSQ